ncbi:hypothetical protein [Nocardia sp. 348MFTsu5.1]|uniref:hypothetical protein n=1 Tax=Nocardia sp. 348MFTsu5.1 TaxID=1172185 RepID=UPI0003625310|nr:hypothetical protein [Nocardia sp. 348MFTsu5.1]
MSQALGALAWVGVALGMMLAVRGGWYRQTATAAFGVCIVFYCLTGENYSTLVPEDGVRQAMNTSERIWGATSAVIAGCALVATLMAIRFGDNESDHGGRSGPDLNQRIMLLVVAAAASIAVINLSLVHSELTPSSDFLADYGHMYQVVVYQAVFAFWIGFPAGYLGWTVVRSELGPLRYLVGFGGLCGVLWAIWKVFVTALIWIAGIHIAESSPVSLCLGFLALAFCVFGSLLLALTASFSAWRTGRTYRTARAIEDRRLRHDNRAA